MAEAAERTVAQSLPTQRRCVTLLKKEKKTKNCHQGAIVIVCPFLEAVLRLLMLTRGQRLVISNRTRSQPPEWAWSHEWARPAPFAKYRDFNL